MRRLLRLEIKKANLKKYIIAAIVCIAFILLFMTVSIVDTLAHPTTQVKDSFDSMIRMASLLVTGTFLVFSSVMYVDTTISGYKNRTVLILFSYPIKRERLIAAKMILVSVFTAIAIFTGFLCSMAYLVFVESHFDALLNSVTSANLQFGLLKAFEWTLLGVILSLIPFGVGMLRKSTSTAIVCAFILIVLMQPIMGRATVGEFLLKTIVALIISASISVYALRRSTHHVDL
jgi:ABC-type transport system involved in multi-copper enzyme maturation permease subunit